MIISDDAYDKIFRINKFLLFIIGISITTNIGLGITIYHMKFTTMPELPDIVINQPPQKIETNIDPFLIDKHPLTEKDKNELIELINNFQDNLYRMRKHDSLYNTYEMNITCYTSSINETDNTPNITALNTKPKVGRTVAVSRDFYQFLGKKIHIDGYGVFIVEDLCGPSITNTIDIYKGGPNDKEDCLEFGRDTALVNVILFD